MSTATIRRGQPARARPKVGAGRRKVAPKKKGMLERLAEHLPVGVETIQRWIGYGVVVTGIGLAGTAATFMGLPQMGGVALAEMVGRAGFEVKRVEVMGIDRMDRLTVYAVALDQHSMAMPLVDLDKVRSDLLRYGWIKDARVSRRLPDTLVVDIVERKPAAIWQNARALSLIDRDGVVLEPVKIEAMPDLPLLIGADANRQAQALAALMEAAPSLKPMMAGASWVGNRRWDLRFQSGETLALPEGEKEAADALVKFARMDGTERLLGRGFVRFDMRLPDRFVVRVPPQGAAKKVAAGGTPVVEAAKDNGDAAGNKGKEDGDGTSTG
ncbi:cell division protein FtsQ/DivIB [Sphingomonas cavernae]|uniref:Cell division protein FtsQ n=1 Tax=Sphingomonas cavernae TaxID=2320861 RepID=A0A418WKH6_9SPHN|nr:cell division protein FtsQ/DivIB [Sphingomonas cavernae]RJF90533.1 FtsQ-type POTRA domain-containing protein [Sphingomonas cavernae]